MQRTVFSRSAVFAMSALALAGCGAPPSASSYFNRGGPESLIDVSSEVVNLNASSAREVKELATWIENDRPTRASLNCAITDKFCTEAKKILELHGVPVTAGQSAQQSITLVYERILARDCAKAYVDNPDNFYNTNHPSFGCSIASNMVQQVTDKQEFVNPSLADDPSAVRAVNDMRRAFTPRDIVKPYAVDESLAGKAKTSN